MLVYFSRRSREGLIRELIAPQESRCSRITVIAHELCDNVLWSVVEFTAKELHVQQRLLPGESLRYIRCDLLHRDGREWGYSPMEESMHPFYYSCPLHYLNMAPERCRDWREGVRAYHATR